MTAPAAAVAAWFSARLPTEWNEPEAEVTTDREEILVRITITDPPGPQSTEPRDETAEAVRAEAIAGTVARFREETRERRIEIAREAERRFGRKVAWAVTCGGRTETFTSLAVPVMTRLRQPERLVLDVLVEAGVARSRAHALAWCVRLVGDNTSTWLADLRTAMAGVEQVRAAGPVPGGRSESAPQE